MARKGKSSKVNHSQQAQVKKTESEKSNAWVLIVVATIGAIATILAATIPPLIPIMATQALPVDTVSITPSQESSDINNLSTDTPHAQSIATLTEIETLASSPVLNEITDSKGAQMVLIPAGEFMMGSNTVASNVQPVHQVYLDDFYIDKYEVTNAQYKACVNLGACKPLDTTLYYDNVKYANNPVTFVDWHKAVAFCLWREARLPTEAEWEKSARGVEELNFPWGNSIDCSYANYRGANGWCVGDSTPIGSYETGKSIFGVYDMVGNAMEWVSSAYADYPYNANDGREGLNVSALRVIRGGSWNSREPDVRITVRAYKSPSAAEFDFGFRCAKSTPP